MAFVSFNFWLGLFLVINLIHLASARQERTGMIYVWVGNERKPIPCDEEGMTVHTIDHWPMCQCPVGMYVKVKSNLDTSLSYCAPCSPCNQNGSRPFQLQSCGMYSNTVCCEYENMTIEIDRQGHHICVMPPTSHLEVKDMSTHPPTKPPECDDGFFLENDTLCVPYSTPNPCVNTPDTVSNDSRDSNVDADAGFKTESPPIPGGTHGSNVLAGDDDNVEDKQKYPRLSFVFIIILAHFLILIPCCWWQRKRLTTYFGSNQMQLEKQAKIKAMKIQSANDIEMQLLARPQNYDVTDCG